MARGRFRIHPLRICMAFLITLCAIINSCWAFLQRLIYDRRIAATEITEPPIFIIGHWRSGTTLPARIDGPRRPLRLSHLLRMLRAEPFSGHRLVRSHAALAAVARQTADGQHAHRLAPSAGRRVCCCLTMGAPTPYCRMAYPNDPPPFNEFLDMDGCQPEDLDRWRHDIKHFVHALTMKKQKRLIMKSPPHTGRIEELSRLFPGAKFVHIVRDPYTIFPSTRRLWVSLDWPQGLQHPHDRNLDEYVFASFERMYRGFNRQREKIVPSQLCEIRYEDLVRDPVGQVRTIYEKLELGDFEQVRPQLEAYAGQQKDYKVNRHDLEPELRSEIRRRWSEYFTRYGYE